MKRFVKKDSTNVTLDVFVQDSSATDGSGLTGLVFNSASLVCYYRRGATGTATQLTLATQTVGGAHSDGGFVEISSTNMPGMYRLDLSDAIVATGVPYVTIMLRGATNMAPVTIELQLVDFDPEDGTRMGMAALPNAAAEAAGGLYTRGTGAGQINQPSNGTIDCEVNSYDSSVDFNATQKASINTQADTALTDYDPPTRTEATSDKDEILTRLGTPAGADMSVDIAAIKAETALIVADTNELQADWADGGRLDLILDAILVDTGTTLPATLTTIEGKIDTIDLNVDAILVDTGTTLDGHLTDIKGTGFVKDTHSLPQCLTATGFSTHSAADVWTSATRTLTAFGFSVTVGTNNDKTGYTLTTAGAQTVADETLIRGASNIEDTADRHSLGAMVMIGTNSSRSGTTLTAKKPSNDSTFATYTLTVDASADPITSVV